MSGVSRSELVRPREDVEARARAHPARERALAGAADHRPVGERIGERKAELDDVRAALDRRPRELRRLRLGHQVDDERFSWRQPSAALGIGGAAPCELHA